MKALLRIAWTAGAAPILLGTVIFIMWLIFRADILMVAGMITIYAGLASVVVGLICLAICLWRNWRSSEVPRRRLASYPRLLTFFDAARDSFIRWICGLQSRLLLCLSESLFDTSRAARRVLFLIFFLQYSS